MNLKVCYIISNINKAIAFEWIIEALKNDFEFEFILIGSKKGHLHHWLKSNQIPVYHIHYNSKKDLPKALWQTFRILRKTKFNTIHTHLFEANIIGLTAGKIAGIKKRIYTRHHSTFHHDNFPKAVKWDQRTNRLATDIVAISKNVQNVLITKEKVSPQKIHLIYHGFKIESFKYPNPKSIDSLKNKYGIPCQDSPVIGCISRYIKLKGVEYIIDAFKKLIEKYPKAHLILANASGPDENYIRNHLKANIRPEQYTEIVFENDLFSLYHLFDYFIHVPIDSQIEAFGQTYIEALAAGVPSIFTLSGVANEFIKHQKNAWVVDYKNSDEIYEGLLTLIEHEALRNSLIKNGKISITPFSLDLFTEKLANLYES